MAAAPSYTSLTIADCNYQADFNVNNYEESAKIIIEFLKSSVFYTPLTATTDDIPLTFIQKSAFTAAVPENTTDISFQQINGTVSLVTKEIFIQAIGFANSAQGTIFQDPSREFLNSTIAEMEYKVQITATSAFKKSSIPYPWQLMVHLWLRCLTGMTGGTDTLSRAWVKVLWSVYTGLPFDIGKVLYDDFRSYVGRSSSEIASARFWALVPKKLYPDTELTVGSDVPKFETKVLGKYLLDIVSKTLTSRQYFL